MHESDSQIIEILGLFVMFLRITPSYILSGQNTKASWHMDVKLEVTSCDPALKHREAF